MAVSIRMTRGGRKKYPFYHIVVADSRSPRDGRFIEKLGYFNPNLPKEDETRLKWDTDRVAHWMSVGAQPSDRVTKMILEGKVGTDTQRDKLKTKLDRRIAVVQKRVDAEKAAKAAEAKAAADAEAAEAAEAKAAEDAAAAEAAATEAPAEEAAAE